MTRRTKDEIPSNGSEQDRSEARIGAELLLAMDTSGDVCSVAVTRGGRFVAETTFRHEMRLSERLMDHVSEALRDAEAVLDDVDVFAVGIGPGSFTGTRIGVMTMKTLAVVQNRPLYGVDSLMTLAATYWGIGGIRLLPLLPCRAEIVFAGLYDGEHANLTPRALIEPTALGLEPLVEQTVLHRPEHVLLCGQSAAHHFARLSVLFSEYGIVVSRGEAVYPRAAQIAEIVVRRRQTGERGDDPLALVPCYVAPPPISLPKPENRPPSVSVEAAERGAGQSQ